MISIVIPTYNRNWTLIETIESLLALKTKANEILIVDQSAQHDHDTTNRLRHWSSEGSIRWLHRKQPSITAAMNQGLREATSPYVLFLDDDIRPNSEVIRAHQTEHEISPDLWATVGQVIQPWQKPQNCEPPRKLKGLRKDDDFPFNSTCVSNIENVMAGNLCVHRNRALSIGGFDERFIGSAFRFETDFARRLNNAGGTIRFLGHAGVNHLRVEDGGTRSEGSHLNSADPCHGFGDHFYALRHADSFIAGYAYCINRIFREVRTKYHLRNPWWIPVKLVGECHAFLQAYSATRRLSKLKRLTG
ncbi:glycosyltransferase family 2 protein [Roseiconus sp. JC912]